MYLLLYCWCLLFIAHLHHADPVHASLETVCNNTLTDSAGLILVPYNSSLTAVYCELTISVSPGDFIIFSLHSMDTEWPCPSYLTVYNGNDTNSLIGSTCSSGCSSPYYSDSNSMLLTFTVGSNRCPPNTYSMDCSRSCHCVQENTKKCSIRLGSCECKDGWTSWDCSQDINECLSPTACPEYSTCINLNGSYECRCYEGFQMSSSGHCEVAMECTGTNCSHVCARVKENGVEVDKCVCPGGMELNGTQCIECANFKYGRNCEHSCQCSTPGTAMCDPRTGNCNCLPGWTSNYCQADVNECSNGSSICGYEAGGFCLNTLGSYDCVCLDGYEKSTQGTCQLIDCNLVFTNTSGVFTSPRYPSRYYSVKNCSWEIEVENGSIIELSFRSLYPTCDGYSYVNVFDGETPTFPALISVRGCGQNTLNDTVYSTHNALLITLNAYSTVHSSQTFIATYRSISCPPFTYLPNCSTSCNCDQANSVRCDLLTGRCVCLSGWTSNDCSMNVNECTQSPCLNYTTCTDTIGSYQCRCQDGLQMNPVSGQCEVPLNSTCTQRNCSHLCVRVHENGQDIEQCRCPVGSKLEGGTCRVCSNLTYGEDCQWECDCVEGHTASCDPTSGQCSCLSGWRSSNCSLDIDECSTGLVYCGLHSDCINTPGSYVCQCSEYYEKNANGTCVYTGCVKTLTQTSGVIKSPNYPSSYDSNSNCLWSIIVPANYSISLKQRHTHKHSHKDSHLKTPDAHLKTPDYHLKTPDAHLKTPDSHLKTPDAHLKTPDYHLKTPDAHLKTQIPTSKPRFPPQTPDAHLKTPDAHLKTPDAHLKTPDTHLKTQIPTSKPQMPTSKPQMPTSKPQIPTSKPRFPPQNPDSHLKTSGCPPQNPRIFSDLNLECGYDYVTVYDGNNISAPQLGRHCQKPFGSLLTTSNTMYITFTSDSIVQYKGFMATFNATGCPPFKYLPPQCNGTCNCVQENSQYCNIFTGHCECKTGWTGPDCSVDVDECLDLPCTNYSQCVNSNGSYECDCLNGLTKSADSGLCEVDVNSTCTKRNCSHVCVKVTENKKKVEKCYCPVGSKLMGTTCKVCDKFTYGAECQNKCSCTLKDAASCDPVRGRCTCLTGWRSQNCSVDIDECSTGNVTCGKNSQCTNTPGSYKCVCNDNFGMDALGYCVFKGFIKQLTNSSGVILSPGYPYFYSSLLTSRWTIKVSKGHVIQLNLTAVDTECGYDDVKVYDGDNELSKPLGRFCRLPNATLVS
ncbi:hypothetical protein Btru_018010 [Bulinus truncatus]|nr:hypothetical protein Btru_018010 [Bulinus truncatus]